MLQSETTEPRPVTHRVRELAKALDMHIVSIYRLIAAGKIDARRVGGALRIPDQEYRRLTGTDAV